MKPLRELASDNAAGAHPKVLEAIARANGGHTPAYGNDPLTEEVSALVAEALGARAVFFVFGGTGGNVVALRSLAPPGSAVLCAPTAHVLVDEAGAPEALAGLQLRAVPAPDGRFGAEEVAPHLARVGDVHAAQPRIVSVTQTTELGTAWRPERFRKLAKLARAAGLRVHLDGARLANAAAFLGLPLREVARGADALVFGGTKNGLLFGEAVAVFDDDLAARIPEIRKQTGQLASKMRFVAAQFGALVGSGLWLENAAHANELARRLAAALEDAGAPPQFPVEGNAVFVRLPAAAIAELARSERFYVWDEATGLVRFMTSWDSRLEDVERLSLAVGRARKPKRTRG